jgi:hypothetical protein
MLPIVAIFGMGIYTGTRNILENPFQWRFMRSGFLLTSAGRGHAVA